MNEKKLKKEKRKEKGEQKLKLILERSKYQHS